MRGAALDSYEPGASSNSDVSSGWKNINSPLMNNVMQLLTVFEKKKKSQIKLIV